jgi:hypothetical protein
MFDLISTRESGILERLDNMDEEHRLGTLRCGCMLKCKMNSPFQAVFMQRNAWSNTRKLHHKLCGSRTDFRRLVAKDMLQRVVIRLCSIRCIS